MRYTAACLIIFFMALILWWSKKDQPKDPVSSKDMRTIWYLFPVYAGFFTLFGLSTGLLSWNFSEKWTMIGQGIIFPVIHNSCWDAMGVIILSIVLIGVQFMVVFTQEVFFRGFLQRKIKEKILLHKKWEKYRQYYPHIIVSSLLYGLIWAYCRYFLVVIDHAEINTLNLHHLKLLGALEMCMGLYYGYIYDKTQLIGITIALHMLLNVFYFIFFEMIYI